MSLHAQLTNLAEGARLASRQLARASAETRAKAIKAIAGALNRRRADVLSANLNDLERAREAGLSAPMIDRLTLNHARLDQLLITLEEIAAQPDPIGAETRAWERPNGLKVKKVRLPLGVILMIYESRPNVTLDAAALCLKSGNAAILRGGSEARETNAALFALVAEGLQEVGLPHASIVMVPTQDREAIDALLEMSEQIDLVIPRGGAGLIKRVVAKSRIPVVRHDQGICHLYVESSAQLEEAVKLTLNAKTQRPGVCNAIETLLVDARVAPSFLPLVGRALRDACVTLKACPRAFPLLCDPVEEATEEDWATEFLGLTLAVRVVDDIEGAIEHIDRYGSRHSAAISTQDEAAAARFIEAVDASCVLVNASTRFNDGGELGLGAEVGISTTRIHAFGPMGAEALTAEKFVVIGQGHVRG
jgi:glutamate-5-semialdehyde dehydrogenase